MNLWGIRADPQQSHHLCIFSWTLTTAWPGFLAALSGKRDFWCPAGILRCLEHRFLFPTDGSAQENNPFPLTYENIHVFPKLFTGNFLLKKLQTGIFQAKKKKKKGMPCMYSFPIPVCGYKYMDLLAISGNRPVPIDSRRYPHLNKHRVLHAALSRGVCLGGDFSHFSHAGIILRQARAANRGPQSKLVSCPE